MLHSHRFRAFLAGAIPLGLSSAALAGDLQLQDIQTGFGQLLPHTIFALDSQGLPTSNVLEIRSLDDLIDNVTASNGVHGTPSLPSSAVLPSGAAGNQYIAVRFDQDIDISSLLSRDPSAPGNGLLKGAITLLALDSNTGEELPISGRAFVGGRTYAAPAGTNLAELPLQQWVVESAGALAAVQSVDNNGDGTPDGLGFPGTESGFEGASELGANNVFVFVMDTDGDLTTHETFPAGVEIVVEVGASVRGRAGQLLDSSARTTTRVGVDNLTPAVRLIEGRSGTTAEISPRNAEQDVDPLSTVTIGFTEPVQLASFGELTGSPFNWNGTSAVQLTAGSGLQVMGIPFTARPVSAYDLSTLVLTPKFAFPGLASDGTPTTGLNQIGVGILAGHLADLSANLNPTSTSTWFSTGVGQGITNCPVAPDTIYVGISGEQSALSVIDLNGFGQGTGNPTYDPLNPTIEGNSNFPNNPNVQLQGTSLRPPLAPGQTTVDGGSAGVFTKTLDSNLSSNLAASPVLLDVSDMALGSSLDLVFNNAPAPFGCQSGGGNICATNGFMQTKVSPGSATEPFDGSGPLVNSGVGVGNTISWAPHPNPPPIVFPPLCVSPFIGSQEPTSVFTGSAFPQGLGLANLLVPGDPFGNPGIGVPPSGLLSSVQNAYFQGPRFPQQQVAACQPYMVRQQVGQFLYVVDRVRKEVVVLNSNRMVPIDRIALPDPARLAMGPNLDLLAVTNQMTGTVSFIDINPSSATFHTVVQETPVGLAPLGIAWDSMNEDILVCNERSDDVSVISAFSLQVRKVVSLQGMQRPFEVVITPRQVNFGLRRNVYLGYVASRDGRISIFESGPSGVNGWGYDDLLGSVPYRFHNTKALAVNLEDLLRSSVWVAHEGKIDMTTHQASPPGTGAISVLGIESGFMGIIPIQSANEVPGFRNIVFGVSMSLGEGEFGLTGIPVDLALDNQMNLGALPGVDNSFSAGVPIAFNSKSMVRDYGGAYPVSGPVHLFVAIPNSAQGGGVVDVIQFGPTGFAREDTNPFQPGIQSVPAPGARVLADYFRQ